MNKTKAADIIHKVAAVGMISFTLLTASTFIGGISPLVIKRLPGQGGPTHTATTDADATTAKK